jgi:hypothetical protein
LHDVVFVVGPSIEQTYERLIDLWFGSAEGLHLDSWMELTVVDGHRVVLTKSPQPDKQSDKKLYFVNLGAYAEGEFTELHANTIVVGTSEREVKARAKSELLRGKNAVHTDDLFDIDDCLEINSVDGYHVVLEPTTERNILSQTTAITSFPKPSSRSICGSRTRSSDRGVSALQENLPRRVVRAKRKEGPFRRSPRCACIAAALENPESIGHLRRTTHDQRFCRS